LLSDGNPSRKGIRQVPRKILISTSSFGVPGNGSLRKLADDGFELILNPHRRRLTEVEAMELLDNEVIAMIAGVEPLTRKVLTSAKQLKVISRCGTGIDNVDFDAVRELGILLKNTPDAPARAVAELTLGMILGVLRRIAEADRGIRAARWAPLMGRLLSEQTVGLIGYGRVGRRVANLVRAFGASVIVYDNQQHPAEKDIAFLSLDEVVGQADVLSLHVPYSKELHHLLDRERIAAMKRGAVLINAARGGLIDENALLEALQSGHLAGAALDCFQTEPYTGPLVDLPQVVLTAHMGSYANEARALMEREAADNLLAALAELGLIKG
jgi:D-3-phosphoglycerate dehydrogenase